MRKRTDITPWSERTGRSTSTYRQEGPADLHVSRVIGAVKHNSPLPWEWSVRATDVFFATAIVERSGRSASEAEAQRDADSVVPAVLQAFEILGVPAREGHR